MSLLIDLVANFYREMTAADGFKNIPHPGTDRAEKIQRKRLLQVQYLVSHRRTFDPGSGLREDYVHVALVQEVKVEEGEGVGQAARKQKTTEVGVPVHTLMPHTYL